MTKFTRSTIALAALLIPFAPVWAQDDEDSFGEPAIAEPLEPQDLTVGSEDLHDMRGETGTVRGHHADTEDPTKMVVGSENLHDMRGSYEDPTQMRGEHENVADLDVDHGDAQKPHPTPDLVAEPSPPGPNASSTERAMWRDLQASEANLDAISGTYENMMAKDYPRGERRQQIIDERDAAIEQVNRARTSYAAAGAD